MDATIPRTDETACPWCERETCDDVAHVDRPVTAADIPWLSPAPWPDARPIVDVALAHLPRVVDDDTAAVIEHLVGALAAQRAERDVLRESLSAALDVAYQCRAERDVIATRYHEALDRLRALREAA